MTKYDKLRHTFQSFCVDYKTVAVGALLVCGTLATAWAGKRVYRQRTQALEEDRNRRTKDILDTNPRGSFLKLICGQVYYEVHEPVDAFESHSKPLLVFVGHPSLRATDLYGQLAEDLFDKGYQCLLFDFIGTGNSHYSAGQTYSLDAYARQMKDILAELEFDKRPIYMISHSMSNSIAMAYITTHGREQVKKSVLLEPLVRDYAEGGRKVLSRIPGISTLLSCSPVSKYIQSNIVQWHLQTVFQEDPSKGRSSAAVRRHIESAMDQNRSFFASVWSANVRQLYSPLSRDVQFKLMSSMEEAMVDTIIIAVNNPVDGHLKQLMPSATCVTIENCGDGTSGEAAVEQMDRFFSQGATTVE